MKLTACGKNALIGTTKKSRLREISTKGYSHARSVAVTRPDSSRSKLTGLMSLCIASSTATIAKPGLQNIDLNEA